MSSAPNLSPIGLNVKKLIPYNVLIVDDSLHDQLLLKQHLKAEMFNVVHTVDNGEKALQYLSLTSESIDIVCIDYVMPAQGSQDAIIEINKLYPKLLVIVITANASADMALKLKTLKINCVIIKPITKEKIIEKFAGVLGRNDIISKYAIPKTRSGSKINLNDLKIPPVPSVMLKVIDFDDNLTAGSQELEQIINPDKALSLDILKISNSSFYGRSGAIKSLKDAITLLGVKTVKNLVILQSKKKFSSALNHEIYKKHINELPIISSLVCFDLINPLNLRALRKDIFTFSLLRRIGCTILALNYESRYKDVLLELEEGNRSLQEIELNEFGVDSREVGMQIFSIWKMPAQYLDILKNQNFQVAQFTQVSDYDRLTRLGEIIAKKLLQLKLSNEEEEMLNLIYNFYKADEKIRNAFGEDYYHNIKEHPYFS